MPAAPRPARRSGAARESSTRRAPAPRCRSPLTLRGPTRADPRAWAAFEALLYVLDGGMAGRVYQRLCVRDGLAYTVDAEIADHGDASLLQFTAEVAPANVTRVVEDTLDVLAGLARRPVAAAELARVRETYRLSVLGQLDDTGAMAEWYGAARLFREPPPVRAARPHGSRHPRRRPSSGPRRRPARGPRSRPRRPGERARLRALRAATAGVRS
ncbi:MAG: insulinase family protein [Vicinamibacteria bacterium]